MEIRRTRATRFAHRCGFLVCNTVARRRLDGKKSVYKKVSEDKTKVEIVKDDNVDVEMKDADEEKKDDEEKNGEGTAC